MSPSVFFVGLGNMGYAMAKNIVGRGNLGTPLAVYNRSTERSTALVQELGTAGSGKIEVADSVAAGVAKADVVWLMLSNDAVVEGVVDEILATPDDLSSKLFIQSATIHPDATVRIADKIAARGAQFVSAPVFGAPAMARMGQLIGVLAGASAAIDRALFLFKNVTCREVIALRDVPIGNAALLKVIGNTFIFNMIEQLAEAHVLAEKTGLGTDALHQFVGAMFPGPYAAYSERMITGQYMLERPLFAVDLARKDIGYALGYGAKTGVPLQNAQTADAHLVQVKEHDGEKGDVAAIYGAVRQEAGLPYENRK